MIKYLDVSRITLHPHNFKYVLQFTFSMVLVDNNSKDQAINLSLDTLKLNKQALVFNATKSSAEKFAEDLSKKIKYTDISKEDKEYFNQLTDTVLHALSSPTKQCERLALCVSKGVAFHHAGLVAKQRELIEHEFKKGKLKIISSTPTLAVGIDMPAYRTIIRSVKRYTSKGFQFIPVLEYKQMAGRAGRPGKETEGQSIIICQQEKEIEELHERYILGQPEEIYSKLAVEPVLRTYILSLVATGLIKTYNQLISFFEKTFWAYQFQDMHRLERVIDSMLDLLTEYGFIIQVDAKIQATALGKKVSQLYLDPYTANHLIESLKNIKATTSDFAYLHMIIFTLEMRPQLSIKKAEYDRIEVELLKHEGDLLCDEPSYFDPQYHDFLCSIKTTGMVHDWINELTEEQLMEKYSIRPGEINYKLTTADWLIYACHELAKLLELQEVLTPLSKLRVRLSYGCKEELLNLLKLKNIGKIRARKLYLNGIKSVSDVKSSDPVTLVQLLGHKLAVDVKTQVGEEVKIVRENKRKGQINLNDF